MSRAVSSRQPSPLLERQGLHLLAWMVLGAVQALVALGGGGEGEPGRAFGMTAGQLMALAWLLAAIFQFGVALVWRLELHRGAVQRRFGRAGFVAFAVVFPVVALARILLLLPISEADAGSLPIPPPLLWILVLGPLPFILWAAHSILFYFPFTRAIGADHFDPAYRGGSLETRGIYRYVRNPMYAVMLLLLYYPGLYYQSLLGLVAAACHHAFVWVHYHCTEKPDIRVIYGGG